MSSNRAPARGSNTNARRAAKRVALAQAAEERKRSRQRRQALLGALGAVLVIALSVLLVVVLGGGSKKRKPSVAGPAAVSVAPSPSPSPAVSVPAALAKKPVVNGSGAKPTKLVVKTLIEGTGPVVKSGQTITVNYVGVSMTTGQEFDSSWKNNQTASFPIGQGRVIKGWDQALVGLKVGTRVQLDIPADLAYGASPPAGYPAGPLRFVVDILATG
ncbi:MAG TPA: FKBP-type peptidyl-prolyl cis-trans isomerase [Rugosimonospora sp.]|nr:FKBP-type peptidyl-prolyl cis-trans isomerase [Rugosimonospora sp.]